MKKRFRMPILFLLCLFSLQVWAQDRAVSGTVLDADNTPLIGVNIIVKGTQRGAVTDFDGNFSLNIPDPNTAVLVFSSLGFVTQEIPVGNKSVFNITMAPDLQSLDEVVVVGFGTQKRQNLTGAVSTVDTKLLQARPIPDVARGLQGTTPGLTITSPSGQIGASPIINLRGTVGSLGSGGGSQPLILVDNVEIPNLNYVNPQDIESISVLKDAASTSIYGARGAWGVILITTKRGKRESTPIVTYSHNTSWSTPTEMPRVAAGAPGAEMALKAYQRSDPNRKNYSVIGYAIDEQSIQRMREWDAKYGGQDLGREMVEGRDFERRDGKLYFFRSWDPMEIFMRKWAPQQKHDLSVSGGGEKTNYYLGLGYVTQAGVLKVNPDKFDRYNLNLSVDTDIRNWWKARASVLHSNKVEETPYTYSSATYDPWYYVTRWPSTYPYGTFDGQPFRSAITEMEQANTNTNTSSLSRVNLGSTFKPLDGLTIDVDYTHDRVESHSHQRGGVVSGYNFWSTGPNLEAGPFTSASFNRVIYGSSWSTRNTAKAFATYEKQFGEHSLKIIGGGDLEEYDYWYHSSERRNLLNPDQPELGLATGDQFVSGSRRNTADNIYPFKTLGFFGRINYAYKDRYLLEVNGRYDGSSRLSADKKWGFFPSVSAGYVISKEDFMEFADPTLSFLKLRASYGGIGNQNANLGNIYRIMGSSSSNWLVGGDNQVTVGTPGALPVGLTWETVTTLDFGVDARFFNNAFGVSYDWYERTVSDMHSAGVTLPGSFGTGAPRRNFGEMQTKGWELAIDFKHQFSNGLNISAMATLSDYEQRVTKFADATDKLPDPIVGRNSVYYEGMVLGEIWGYETDRLFTEADFDSNGNYASGVANQDIFVTNSWFKFGPGDVKYKDLNGDGVIGYGKNTRDDHGDLKVIGNTTPRYQYGINLAADYKGFDLSIFMQGVGKRDMWANGPVIIPGYRPNEGWYEHQLDYWTPENPNAFFPRPSDAGQQVNPTNFQPQTRYLLDMSYLRMKNITFGYSLPETLLDNIGMHRFRIYFSGENLFEFTNLDIPLDPEIDYTTAGLNDPNSFGRVYPFSRTVSLGVQVSF